MIGVNVTPVAYKVTIWPGTVHCIDQALWCVTVRDEGFGNWSVRRGNASGDAPALGRDWLWHHENLPSERTRAEIQDHRFAFHDALARAREMAPRVELQGMTALEALARHRAKDRCAGCEGPYTTGHATRGARTMIDAQVTTVGELADFLATQPRDRKIILRKDAEGNGHSPLAEAWEAMYAADSTWSGQTYMLPEELAGIMAGDNLQGWSDEDAAPDDAERVIVLGPVN